MGEKLSMSELLLLLLSQRILTTGRLGSMGYGHPKKGMESLPKKRTILRIPLLFFFQRPERASSFLLSASLETRGEWINWCLGFCNTTIYSPQRYRTTWYNVVVVGACVVLLSQQSLYLSRMKNQRGHWVCRMSTSGSRRERFNVKNTQGEKKAFLEWGPTCTPSLQIWATKFSISQTWSVEDWTYVNLVFVCGEGLNRNMEWGVGVRTYVERDCRKEVHIVVALSNSEGQTAGGTRERQQRRALATTYTGRSWKGRRNVKGG